VLLLDSLSNTVGGVTAAARNLISGNVVGVETASSTAGRSTADTIEGNFIGTNAAGTAAVPNTVDGVFVNNVAGNAIGGTARGAANVLAGNLSTGVQLYAPGARGNMVLNNTLGFATGGAHALPNGQADVFLNGAGRGNSVRGNHGQRVTSLAQATPPPPSSAVAAALPAAVSTTPNGPISTFRRAVRRVGRG
jgi:titin